MIAFLKRIYLASITPVEEQRPAKDGVAEWAKAYRAHKDAVARNDKRGMGQALPAVQAAMRARLEAERELGSLAPLVPTEGHGPGVVA